MTQHFHLISCTFHGQGEFPLGYLYIFKAEGEWKENESERQTNKYMKKADGFENKDFEE